MRHALRSLLLVAAVLLPSLALADASLPGELSKAQQNQKPTTCGTDTPGKRPTVKTPSGLRYQELQVGKGALAVAGTDAKVLHTLWLSNGEKIDSTDGRDAFQFHLGGGQVIKGFDEGIAGMRVGGKRRLFLTPALGYGDSGARGTIPPNSDLTFEVELLAVTPR